VFLSYIYYITTRSIHESSDFPAPARASRQKIKSAPQSHTRCLIIPSLPLSLQSGQWRSANRFRRIYIYIYYIPDIHVYISERGGIPPYHGSGTYELLNRRLSQRISELLPICPRLLYSYYHFIHTQRITYRYVYNMYVCSIYGGGLCVFIFYSSDKYYKSLGRQLTSAAYNRRYLRGIGIYV